RSDRVILRRIRTNTTVTPALQAKVDRAGRVRHPDDLAPVIAGDCTRCGSKTTVRARRATIYDLPACHRPKTFVEWTRPGGDIQHRKIVLDSLLMFIREAGIRHYF
ncbi:hypothetical protein HPB47_007359, partial [Ixodes persulcatus]